MLRGFVALLCPRIGHVRLRRLFRYWVISFGLLPVIRPRGWLYASDLTSRRDDRGGPHPLDRFASQLRWNPGS